MVHLAGMLSGGASRQTGPASRINMLKMEADILAKSISRLHQHDMGLSVRQEGQLILRYRAQLRSATEEIERIEGSMQPDLGPLKDGLAKLVESRFTALDQRLHELSSKMDAMVEERRRPEPVIQRPAPERRPDPAIQPKGAAQVPATDAGPAAADTEESEDDIDELRKRIMTTLKKLDQAEVE